MMSKGRVRKNLSYSGRSYRCGDRDWECPTGALDGRGQGLVRPGMEMDLNTLRPHYRSKLMVEERAVPKRSQEGDWERIENRVWEAQPSEVRGWAKGEAKKMNRAGERQELNAEAVSFFGAKWAPDQFGWVCLFHCPRQREVPACVLNWLRDCPCWYYLSCWSRWTIVLILKRFKREKTPDDWSTHFSEDTKLIVELIPASLFLIDYPTHQRR